MMGEQSRDWTDGEFNLRFRKMPAFHFLAEGSI